MTEHTNETSTQSDAVPAPAAPEDVSGHAVMIGGLWFTPPGDNTGRPTTGHFPQLSEEPPGPVPLEPREPRTGLR